MKKIKQIAKFSLFLIGIVFLLKSCEKDRLVSELSQEKSKYSKITFNELPNNLLPDVNQLKSSSSIQSKSSAGVLIYDTKQIIKLVDSLENTKYSVKFNIQGQPYNVLYNLILGQDNYGNKKEPFIIKYTINNFEEVYQNNKYNFSKMKGSIKTYKYYSFLNYIKNLGKKRNKKTNQEDAIEDDPCDEYDNTGGSNSGGNAGSGSGEISSNPEDDENILKFEDSSVSEGTSDGDSTTCNVLLWYSNSADDLDNLYGISWSCTDGTKGNADLNKSAKTDNLDCPKEDEIPINEGVEEVKDDPSCKSFNFKKLGNYNYSYVKGIRFLVIDKNGHKDYVKYENPIEFGAPYKDRFNNIYENGPLSESSALALSEAMTKTKEFLKNNVFTSQGDIERYFEETLISVYPDYIPGGRVKIRPNEILFPPTDYKAAGFSIGGISFGLDNCD